MENQTAIMPYRPASQPQTQSKPTAPHSERKKSQEDKNIEIIENQENNDTKELLRIKTGNGDRKPTTSSGLTIVKPSGF
jgi:hypothetical protein